MSTLPKHYQPNQVEDRRYEEWLEKGYFHSTPDDREPYAIVIPPPNVTGRLHMGHMLNNTIQDILIRRARLMGKNACWVPGTDHASIATEAKVVRALREKGIKKSDLTREEFLKHAWDWTDEYGGIILKQLRKLGASADWDRTAFTMDEVRSKQVIKAFIDLYNSGKLYRRLRMVNWDSEAQTVLSNEEVIYQEETDKLYHIKYEIEGEDGHVVIATTRPETIMADSGVAIHPEDDRFQHLTDKKVLVPLINRAIPIIKDDYVEREFGTGCLKVTPAHDPNDYEIGLRHDLEVIDILHPDGRLNDKAQIVIGQDRFEARKEIVRLLEESGHLVKVEDLTHNVGRSERTNSVVEPRLSLQWYVNMKELAAPALEAVMSDEIDVYPKNLKNTYRHWMENIRDWCISRQLWWGHQIPAYYYGEEVFVATSHELALEQAQAKYPDKELTLADLVQDEDVLDTWFSSWLWPFSVFDGMEEGGEIDYYYPTAVLVTGWDIIFLWVARMIMSGYEWKGGMPFKDVYFTGMVRDKLRRKMSKSLGNSPDALALIEQFGADGVRFGMLSSSPAGGDLLFDEKLCEQGKNFCNKLWNALRLIKGWEISEEIVNPNQQLIDDLVLDWFEDEISIHVVKLDQAFDQYKLSEGLIELYSFVWNDFCSWLLEMVKPAYGEPISKSTYDRLIEIYSQLMTILHPFMPFITEEIWHELKDRKESEDCIVSKWPTEQGSLNEKRKALIANCQEIISKVRDARNKNQIAQKVPLALQIQSSELATQIFDNEAYVALLKKMANLENITIVDQAPSDAHVSMMAQTTKCFLILGETMNKEEELKKLQDELVYMQGFVKSVEKKLSNERFVQNAPEAVVAKERKKLADGQEKIAAISEAIERLG